MLASIFDRLAALWRHIRPFYVCNAWESGVVLRLGRVSRACGPGLVWLWPLFEHPHVTTTSLRSSLTRRQDLTVNGESVSFYSFIAWRVCDPRYFITSIENGENSVVEAMESAAAEAVSKHGRDVTHRNLQDVARLRLSELGVNLVETSFASISWAPAVRLIQS